MTDGDDPNDISQRSKQLAKDLIEAMQRPGADPERAEYDARKEREDRAALEDYYRRTGQVRDPMPHTGTANEENRRAPGPPVPLRSFGFQCVQGLWGGSALWAAEDRSAIIQVVGPGLWEKRYRDRLTEEQWAEVERLVGAHRLLAFRSCDRHGLPDEARPAILLVTRAGESVTAGKWANDAHPDFDPVYAYLLSLCGEAGELVREGPFEELWPEGFELPDRPRKPG
jgi:hypothetical protein